MPYKIEKIEKKDIQKINKVLIKEIGKSQIKHLEECRRKGIVYKLVVENEILAFCLAYEYEEYISLSYFFVEEKIRRKLQSLFFILFCFDKMTHKPIYIKQNKNLKDYKRYFEKTEDRGIWLFTGFRKDIEWVEKLRDLQEK